VAKKINYGKIAVVIFLTCLVWVWADLAMDEDLPDKAAVISVDESANPKLWVSFNGAPLADIKITLSGPHPRIAEESRRLREGKRMEFDFDISQEKMEKAGGYMLDLLAFLQKNKEIKRLGLKVKSCEPRTLSVDVVELEKKLLDVKFIDKNQNPVNPKTIAPPQIEMLVPKDRQGSNLVATVMLTDGEITQARSSVIEQTPYVEFAPGQLRKSPTTVKVMMPPEAELLQQYNIASATIGFVFSPVLQGKYRVELLNQPDMAMVGIRASPAARNAYEQQPFQILLYILDGDEKNAGEQKKKVVYNFPEEFVRSREIELKSGQPLEAKFKLIPLPSVEQPAAGAVK